MKTQTRKADKELYVIAGLAVVTTLAVTVDQALRATPNPPYSPIWSLLNPFYTTQMPYRIYLAAFELIALAGMIYAVRNWNLPQPIAYLQASALMVFSILHWHQNITVVAFAWTAWYAWPLALLALQKLPLGWSLDLQDKHYDCFTNCFQYADGAQHNAWTSLLARDTLHTATYVLLVSLALYPAASSWRAKRTAIPQRRAAPGGNA